MRRMGDSGDSPMVRTVESDDDIRDFLTCLRTAFLVGPAEVTDELLAWARRRWDLARTWSAFDVGGQCATTRTFATGLRLPGGGEVPVSALTQVTVLPTHTRRGHLSALMRTQLDHAVAAGEVASILITAEWPIYGRFGYGPATHHCELRVDARRARFLDGPVGTVELVEPAALRAVASAVYAAHHAATPGAIGRDERWLDHLCGTDPRPDEDPTPTRRRVMHRDGDGAPDGWVVYDPKQRWTDDVADGTATVVDWVAATPTAERELWRYLLDIDLVTEVVRTGPADGAGLPLWLHDGRAVRRPIHIDHIWVRLLDVPAALEARAYAVPGTVVLDVVDPFLARGGRFRLDAAPDGATCEAAPDAAADLTVDIRALGAAWLGGTLLAPCALAGLIDEHRPGALAEASAMLSWPVAPLSVTDF